MTGRMILHCYDESPFTQKALLMMGIKQAAYDWVQTPMMPPKPDLVALTGGYRGTPVLQIGADIYIDSQLIARKLDELIPQPPLVTRNWGGLSLALVKWSDHFFRQGLAMAIEQTSDEWPEAFLEDRKYLFHDIDFEVVKREAKHAAAHYRAHVSLIEDQLSDGRPFLCGDAPELADIQAYPFLWMARGGLAGMDRLLQRFAHVAAWEKRMLRIGVGERTPMEGARALDVARQAEPVTQTDVDPSDPQGLQAGELVTVEPDDTRRGGVRGEVVIAQCNEIAIRRESESVGTVIVHYPRLGYRVVRSASGEQPS